MKIWKLIILWLGTISLCLTLYGYGQVSYYWYGNDAGKGYALKTWKGDTLDNESGYQKGYTFQRYEYRYENYPEARTIAIILLLMGAGMLSLIIWKDTRQKEVMAPPGT
ncbi:MAG: hypothetical protein A2Y21_12030 [Clostridiales bacterium GWC2_40_7]|nr:MAG: hypothetical protein A2Y21_12030 [Clostridiales bacterium GWC2_40_7]